MNIAQFAAICTAVGLLLLVAGCALIATWLALIVGGGAFLAVGLYIDEPRRRTPP